ncbi:MAG: 2-hydroxyglutaryl-CoA dehydratase [Firmicutes bacterium]|nr:2-hydroxyglutaryl-CoA dehydratase [Bacillota bacterium]
MLMRIGIPSTLAYYEYFPFWDVFFRELGFEVVSSPITTKAILDWGVKHTVSDACVPIKLVHGHVRYLAEEGVDLLFLPRMVRVAPKETFCPKFLGLPDLIQASINNLPPLLSPRIFLRYGRMSLFRICGQTANSLGVGPLKGLRACAKALDAWHAFLRSLREGMTVAEALGIRERTREALRGPRLALLGYPYLINDPFISANLLALLEERGVQVFTAEMVPSGDLKRLSRRMRKNLFWHYSNRAVWAAMYYLDKEMVDGVIHVTAFGCGPDAMTGKLVELEAKGKVPFTTLSLDEHTGQEGIITRIDAFVDMLVRKKAIA